MKKLSIWLIVLALMMQLALPALANMQLPVASFDVDNVYYVIGENIVTGEPILNPTMTVSWTDPSQWAQDDVVHTPDYYELIAENLTFSTSETIQINSTDPEFTSKTMDLHNEIVLETGSLYKLSMQPYHYHYVDNGTELVQTLASSAQEPELAYALTDLEIEFETTEDSIQVIWDDLGQADFEYRIVYAVGDYSSSTKTNFLNNKEGEITGLTVDTEDVTSFYDPIAKRDKLAYTISEGVYPGQVYSVMVEPTTEYYNGNVIVRNRNYPYIKSVSTSVNLSLVEEGDYLRLQWEIPSSFKVGQDQNEYALVEATLKEYQSGLGRNLVIFDGDAAAIGYYRIMKPIYETEYEIELVYSAVDDASKPDINPVSNRVTFVPSEYLIEPTKPYVPKVLSEAILEDFQSQYTLEEIYDLLEEDYLIPGYSFGGALDDLFDLGVTYNIDDYNTAINYVWGAFQRLDVDVTSTTYGEYLYDTNVYYDVWVTDELSTLSYATPILEDARYNSTTDDHVILNNSNDIIGYKQKFNFYYDTEAKDIIEVVPNQIYYIKVQAKKVTSQGTMTSEPSITTIYYTYDGDAYEPPTIAKPPLKVKDSETTTTGVTINWREEWYEIISPEAIYPDALSNWQYQVWVDTTDGTISSVEIDNSEYFAIYEGEGEIQRLRDYLATFGLTPTIVSRYMDLGKDDFGVTDVKYKFIKILYQTVLDEIEAGQLVDADYSFEDYFVNLVEEDKDGTATLPWYEITPYTDTDDSSYFAYRDEGLVENTSYLFILYPYRELFNGDVLYAHYPTPIVVSTLPEFEEVEPDPTVPSLYVTDFTDTTITATWKYNTDFEYDLMISSVEDVTGADAVAYELPTNILDPNYPVDGEYYEVVVDDLFPLTTYYFWIRARQISGSGVSTWSNPAIGTTLDVDAPIPPRGLGLAPVSVTEDYGYDQNVTEDYMLLQWILDLDDVEASEESKVTKSYTYILEIADNAKFIDPWYVESTGGTSDLLPSNGTLLEKNLLYMEELVGNRHYYVRAKTRLVVEGSEEGQYIEKDSITYTEPIRIITLSSGDEYDGEIDPALTILPSEDYEMIYNEVGNYLEFRFRSDEEDSDGNSDNGVDQRLISSLIENDTYEYEIDLRSYSDQTVENRRIVIPYSIIAAFETYQIDMKILTDNMDMTIPMSAIVDKVNDQVEAYGVNPTLLIDIDDLESQKTKEEIGQAGMTDVSTPTKLGIRAVSSRKTDPIYYADSNLTMGLKTSSRYAVYEKDTAVYLKDSKANWRQVTDTSYDSYERTMYFETPYIGSYGLYTIDRSTAVTGVSGTTSHWSEPYRQAVYEQFSLVGMSGIYDPSAKVSEKAVIWSNYGTIKDMDTIDVTGTLDATTMTTLQRAGVKTNSSQSKASITREESIAMFVRTYEITHKITLPVDSNTRNAIAGVSGVDSVYVEALTKAKAVGLLSDVSSIRPDDALTYAEWFTLWSKVIQ